jgi:hypothetical protein
MGQSAGCRTLAVMGSGETSPTMVTVHRTLVSRLLVRQPRAVVLETPYAFQENAADVSARACSYFARSVGLDVSVAGGVEDDDVELAALRSADWVFSGPGSPSYALEHWQAAGVGQLLRDRVSASTGVTVMASAAAATIGCAALPVYEIYKAGSTPRWLDGLDLLRFLGLRAALIPHYDNAEGGTHDTRYCYLGERRLSLLERELPDGAVVLGVDEHTAVIFDLAAARVEVIGRGALTVRRAGGSTVVTHGTALSLTELQELARHAPAGTAGGPGVEMPEAADDDVPPTTLMEITQAAIARFEAAAAAREVPGMVSAILDLDTAITDWAADTEEDQRTSQSRAVLRSLITRLGDLAAEGGADPRQRLAPAVDPLLRLRAVLRDQGLYPCGRRHPGGAGRRRTARAGHRRGQPLVAHQRIARTLPVTGHSSLSCINL